MRAPVALLLAALVLVTAVVPRHRCTPLDGDGRSAVVFFGMHAHEGHGHEGPGGHDCGERHGPGGCPEGDDGCPGDGPCCVDEPVVDPAAPPARAGFDVAPPSPTVAWSIADATVVASAPTRSTWHVPISRAPTETVVLLR